MRTYILDDERTAIMRPVEKITANRYRCEVVVGARNDLLTDSKFVGEGATATLAESDALRQAREAICAQISKYQQPVPDEHCPRCGGRIRKW
jgi:hypothetical protein